MAWMWITYGIIMLGINTLVGWHLGRFRKAYTEMTGMMAGMTMGMMGGFVLGYSAAAAVGQTSVGNNSLLYGNLFGILLGLLLGVYYGRAGGVMGMMDGSMGGVMGGSMGAMLAAMLTYPREALFWTAVLLTVIFLASMVGLAVLIEQSAPDHEALHIFLPFFTRAVRTEAAEEIEASVQPESASPLPGFADYYTFLGLQQDASTDAITKAYLAKLSTAEGDDIQQAEQALATLSSPARRAVYDKRLQESIAANGGRPLCCPPPRKKKAAVAANAALTTTQVTSSVPASAQPYTQAEPALRLAQRKRRGTKPAASQQQYASRPAKQAPLPRRQNREAPISWVGVVAGGVLVVMLVTWWLLGLGGHSAASGTAGAATGGPPPENNALLGQLEPKAVTAPIGADGKQTLDLVIDGNTFTYKPDVIKLKLGVPVHFDLKTAPGRDPGCARLVIFRGLSVYAVAKPGQVVPIDFTPTQAGVYDMNCGMNMMKTGYVIVQ